MTSIVTNSQASLMLDIASDDAGDELSADETYTMAADALTDGDLERYAAIRAASPGLDWGGHDRRAERVSGVTLADQEPDPQQLRHLRPDPLNARLVILRQRGKRTAA